MSRVQKNDEGNMSVVGHLTEIRDRLAISLIVLIVAFFACFAFIKPLANLMLEMGKSYGFEYVYLSPSELLTSYFKLSLILAVAIVSPFLVFQVWGFIAPALRKREKKAILPALFGGFAFFLLGAVFAYMVALPFMIQFLINYSRSDMIASAISVGSYIDFMIGMILVFGVVFEMPMLSFVLSRLGVITPELLRKIRPFVVPIVFLIGAIITPPDVVSQFMVAVPMLGLYEISILISAVISKKRQDEGEDEEEDEDEEE